MPMASDSDDDDANQTQLALTLRQLDAERQARVEEQRKRIEAERKLKLALARPPKPSQTDQRPDPSTIFRSAFLHGYADLDPAFGPIKLYDLSLDAHDNGLMEPRKSFQFFCDGDTLLTVEGHIITVSEADHPYLVRQVDNSIAKIPRVLEPMARLLYGMLIMSNYKLMPWDQRQSVAINSPDWDECIVRTRDPSYRVHVYALEYQEGKTVSGIVSKYMDYAVEGLCPVIVVQRNGGRSSRSDEFRINVEKFCSWESSGDPNHITVRQCFETILYWADSQGIAMRYPEYMARFFLAGREFKPQDRLNTMRVANYVFSVNIFVPSPASLHRLKHTVNDIVAKYGSKDDKIRLSLLWDEFHETMNGDMSKEPRQVVDDLVNTCCRLDALSATPLNLIINFMGCNIITKFQHAITYYGFGERVDPARRIVVRSFYDAGIKQWSESLPESGLPFPTSLIESVMVRNLLRRAVCDMVIYPDKNLPGWRHLKVDVARASTAQDILWDFVSIQELGLMGIEWMTAGTKTDRPAFSGCTKSGTRIYVPHQMMYTFKPIIITDYDRTADVDQWMEVTITYKGISKVVEMARRYSLTDSGDGNTPCPPGRSAVYIFNLPGFNLIDALDVMEAIWRHPSRKVPVRVLAATGPANKAGVVNKSTSHSTMLTDEVALTMRQGSNPVHTTANASNKAQSSGRLCGQFPLDKPTAPPTLWCNWYHSVLIRTVPRMTRELARLAKEVDLDDPSSGNLLEALVNQRIQITKDDNPELHFYAAVARRHHARITAQGKPTNNLTCNIFTGNTVEGKKHFNLLRQLNTEDVEPELMDSVDLGTLVANNGHLVNYGDDGNATERWVIDPEDSGESDNEEVDPHVMEATEVRREMNKIRVTARVSTRARRPRARTQASVRTLSFWRSTTVWSATTQRRSSASSSSSSRRTSISLFLRRLLRPQSALHTC